MGLQNRGGVSSSPVVADGKVYVGSQDNKVYCLDASNGDLVWNYTTDDLVVSRPDVANGIVYVGGWDGKLYALDALDGESCMDFQNWRKGGFFCCSS